MEESAIKAKTRQKPPRSRGGVRVFLRIFLRKFKTPLYAAYFFAGMPLLFFICYDFPILLTRQRPIAMLEAVCKEAMSAAWASLPVTLLGWFLLRLAFRRKSAAWKILTGVFASVAAWIVAWNIVVFPTFTYWRAILPAIIVTLSLVGWPLLMRAYRNAIREMSGYDRNRRKADEEETA